MTSQVLPFESFRTDQRTSLAIGNFDGVHIAHQGLIRTMVQDAREIGAAAYVLTFEPHPRKVLNGSSDFHLLQTYPRKYESLLKIGLDGVVVANFTPEFSQVSPLRFLEEICTRFSLESVSVGFNFSFGKGAEGTPDTMRSFLDRKGIHCHILEPVQVGGVRISSAFLRNEISKGRLESYKEYTGRFFLVEGTVTQGRKRGRKLGFATANLQSFSSLLKHGVYIARVFTPDEKAHQALVHLGPNPTFEDEQVKMEVHIPGLDQDLYGEHIQVEFLKYLREVRNFQDSTKLKERILMDLQSMDEFFSNARFENELTLFTG